MRVDQHQEEPGEAVDADGEREAEARQPVDVVTNDAAAGDRRIDHQRREQARDGDAAREPCLGVASGR